MKHHISTSPRVRALFSIGCALALASASVPSAFAAETAAHLIVHEWGTFTSVQGGDGKQLRWQSDQVSDLPGFVYNWKAPGLDREPPIHLLLGKGAMEALQRMETPVIYFYSDSPVTADVTVRFPKGIITEWYPQAIEIEPLRKPAVMNTAFGPEASNLRETRIRWSNIRIPASRSPTGDTSHLPISDQSSHYFAARDADASVIELETGAGDGRQVEHEKFLFYRGVGNFDTPLQVLTSEDGVITVRNTGPTPLAHLFLLQVRQGRGTFALIDSLTANTSQMWMTLASATDPFPMSLDILSESLGQELIAALTGAGLFPKEARAMVDTWSDSWFVEDGVRVLYLLPQIWTGEILPLTMKPEPQELVRVMVGRAEIITPEIQNALAQDLLCAESGNDADQEQLAASLRKLGRFAGPAQRLARARLGEHSVALSAGG